MDAYRRRIVDTVFLVAVAFLAGSLFLRGCGSKTNYHIVQENAGTTNVNEMRIRFGNFQTLPTLLPSKLTKTLLFVGDNHPLPEQAEVSWTARDGGRRVKTVAVKPLVPPQARLVAIVFSIGDNDDLRVSVKKASE